MDDIPAGEGVNTGLEPVVVQQELCESLVGISTTPGQCMRQLTQFPSIVLPQCLIQKKWLSVNCIECLKRGCTQKKGQDVLKWHNISCSREAGYICIHIYQFCLHSGQSLCFSFLNLCH